MVRRCFLLVVLSLLFAAPASADTQVGIQNDTWVLSTDPADFPAEMARAEKIRASWVRIMIVDTHWSWQAGAYVQAARTLREVHHKKVMLTLMAYETHPTPEEWAAFTTAVTAALAPYADAWGIMNEPNHSKMHAATPEACATTAGDPTSWAYTVVVEERIEQQRKWRYKRVKKGRGKYVRKWRRASFGKHGRWVYTRVYGKKRKKARWVRVRIKPKSQTRSEIINGTSPGEIIRLCQATATGTAYRRVWDQAAPVIRSSSGAPICVGDLAPSKFNREFMESFYEQGVPAVTPNMLCVHPYDDSDPAKAESGPAWNVSGIYGAAEYARFRGLELWVTEWAYWPEQPADWWPTAMSRMRSAGATAIFIYDALPGKGGTWDTFMRPSVLEAVAGWSG